MEMLRRPLENSLEDNRARLEKLSDSKAEKAEMQVVYNEATAEFEDNRHSRRKAEAIERAKAKLINAT